MKAYFCKAAFALSLTASLAACGGDGGNVASAPPPPTYTKLADLKGDQTFQSGGIRYLAGGSFSNQATETFGSGVRIAYSSADDSYTLTSPVDGKTSRFDPFMIEPNSDASSVRYRNNLTGESLLVRTPIINGVPLSYTLLGNWIYMDESRPFVHLMVGGVPTVARDMPKSGTATYTTGVDGAALHGGPLSGPINPALTSASSSTFSANFGTGAIDTSLHLVTVERDFGMFRGTGSIASGTPSFTGAFAGTITSGFSGAFFGPRAGEMAYDWHLSTDNVSAVGVVWGKKN